MKHSDVFIEHVRVAFGYALLGEALDEFLIGCRECFLGDACKDFFLWSVTQVAYC